MIVIPNKSPVSMTTVMVMMTSTMELVMITIAFEAMVVMASLTVLWCSYPHLIHEGTYPQQASDGIFYCLVSSKLYAFPVTPLLFPLHSRMREPWRNR